MTRAERKREREREKIETDRERERDIERKRGREMRESAAIIYIKRASYGSSEEGAVEDIILLLLLFVDGFRARKTAKNEHTIE